MKCLDCTYWVTKAGCVYQEGCPYTPIPTRYEKYISEHSLENLVQAGVYLLGNTGMYYCKFASGLYENKEDAIAAEKAWWNEYAE